MLEIAKNNGKFGSFLKLVSFSGLETELNAEGPFTLLAPTDEAFDHLKEDVKKKAFEDKDYAAK